MCDPLVGCLVASPNTTTKRSSLGRLRHDFPAAQWKNVLGQTLARCVAVRMQVGRDVVQLRVEAAECLQSGLLYRADDKVVSSLRKQKMYLAYLLIQAYCEQAINHLPEIENCGRKECPLEAREAISSLLYVMPRCEGLNELRMLKPLISSKFGKSFVAEVAENSILCAVDKEIMLLLSYNVPNWPARKLLLEELAIDFDINWRIDSKKLCVKGDNTALARKSSCKNHSLASSGSRKGSIASSGSWKGSVGSVQQLKLQASSSEPLGQVGVSSDGSDTDEEGGGASTKLSRSPSRLPGFEDIKAYLISLNKRKQQ